MAVVEFLVSLLGFGYFFLSGFCCFCFKLACLGTFDYFFCECCCV